MLRQKQDANNPETRLLAEFEIPSQPGNELRVVDAVIKAIRPLGMPDPQVERLKTAVAETAMNAMEHGNHFRAELPLRVRVENRMDELVVQVIDMGEAVDTFMSESPDLEAKLSGLQSPRGWGLFLVRNMVDDVHAFSNGACHTVELVLKLKGEDGHDPNSISI